MYVFIFAVLLSCTPSTILLAEQKKPDSAKYMFYNANNFYKQAKYDEAVKEYEQILRIGFESGNLYYNLANSYLRKGNLGKAILNYERAKKLIPGDKDLEANYEYAESPISNGIAKPKISFLRKLVDEFYAQFTLNETTVLLALIYAFILLILTARIFLKADKLRKYSLLAIVVLVIFFIVSSFSLYKKISILGKEAIVVVKDAEAKFEPFDRATTYFTIYEGAKIYILAVKDDWSKIKRSDKKIGWIKKTSLEII